MGCCTTGTPRADGPKLRQEIKPLKSNRKRTLNNTYGKPEEESPHLTVMVKAPDNSLSANRKLNVLQESLTDFLSREIDDARVIVQRDESDIVTQASVLIKIGALESFDQAH